MWTAETRALVGDFGAGQALSDEQYALLAPLIPPAKPGGRPRSTDMRRLLDGLFYLVRTGCQWRHLPPPPAFPPWRTVYEYMRAFAGAGVWEAIRHHLVVMLRRLERLYPWLRVVFADGVYDRLAALLACFLLGLTLIVVRRLASSTGFVLLPRRWVAERTLAWLGRWRRLAKEYEELPQVSETMVKLAMIRLMLHRLAHPSRKRLPAPRLPERPLRPRACQAYSRESSNEATG